MSDPVRSEGMPASPQRTPTRAMSRRRFAILVLPYLWLVGAIPFVGHAHAYIFQVPVLEVWMLTGVIVCSACLAAATYLGDDSLEEYVRVRSHQGGQS